MHFWKTLSSQRLAKIYVALHSIPLLLLLLLLLQVSARVRSTVGHTTRDGEEALDKATLRQSHCAHPP